MVVVRDPNETYEFVCPEDESLPEGDPQRTVWLLRHLSGQEQTKVGDLVGAMAIGSSKAAAATFLSDVGRLACAGWDQIPGPNGAPVEFAVRAATVLGLRVQACDTEVWESLPLSARKTIGEHVVQRVTSGIPEDERKNS